MPPLGREANAFWPKSGMLMEAGGTKNKRTREEEISEDISKHKDAKFEEVGISDYYTNLASFSSEKSVVLTDDNPWSFEDAPVSKIRGMAIRKQSYFEDFFDTIEEVVKLEEEESGDLFEELWRPLSPLCGAAEEGLFGGSEYLIGANADSIFRGERDSAFIIWGESAEEEDDGERNMNRKCQDEISLLYGNDLASSVWGTPLNQPLLPHESLESELSTPSL